MDFINQVRAFFSSLFTKQVDSEDDDADPLTGSTWCVLILIHDSPAYLHFPDPGEARVYIESMGDFEYHISEPFFCDCPTRARTCFTDAGEVWRKQPQQERTT